MIEPKKIKLTKLVGNTGQIEGLPRNPRKWDDYDVQRLADSINETPMLAEARPLIGIKNGGKYVILGGNLRLTAFRKLGIEEVSCYLLPIDTPIDKLKEIVMKDNSSFGDWDADELANTWDCFDLSAWGVNVAGLDAASEYEGTNTEIDTEEWTEDMTMKFKLNDQEYAYLSAKFEGKDAKAIILNALGYGAEN